MVLTHLFCSLDLVSYDFWLNSAIKKAQNECRFNSRHITKKAVFQCHTVYGIMTSFMTLSHHANMKHGTPKSPISWYTDTFIFFLRSLCKIIWMNVHYFPNAPRIINYGYLFVVVLRSKHPLKVPTPERVDFCSLFFIAPRTSFFQWDCLKCITWLPPLRA